MKKEQNRFNIDFFEFSFLVEACIPPRPIARSMFWDDVINKHYHTLTENERERLFEWINRCYGMEHGLENKNEDCLLFNARFDPDNQYIVTSEYKGSTDIHKCFLWQGKYHLSKTTSIEKKYIVKTEKIQYNTTTR